MEQILSMQGASSMTIWFEVQGCSYIILDLGFRDDYVVHFHIGFSLGV